MKNRKPTDSFPNDVIASVRELNETIDQLVSMKPLLQKLSKIRDNLDKLTKPNVFDPSKISNGKH